MNDFFLAMSPHLTANILTVAFVYSLVLWSKAEKEGREPKILAVGSFFLIGVFLIYGMYLHGALSAFR